MSKPMSRSKPACRAGLGHADHAAGRAGQDRVLAAEQSAAVSPPDDIMNISAAARAAGVVAR